MNIELLNQVSNIFDTSEKWAAHMELLKSHDSLKNLWYARLAESLKRRFLTEDIIDGWQFRLNSNTEMQWFLTEFGENSISLWLERSDFSLFAHITHQPEKVKEYLKTQKFSPLISCFGRIDSHFQNDGYMVREIGNFSFNSPSDTKIDSEQLAWYAGNRTNEYIEQITQKVNRIRRNSENTALLIELNELTKQSF